MSIPGCLHSESISGFQRRPAMYLVIIIISTVFITTGCIHTYPTPENSVDPTVIKADLVFEFEEEWKNIEITAITDKDKARSDTQTRGENWPRRLWIKIRGQAGIHETLSLVIEPNEITDGMYTFTLPFKLKADLYHIEAWCDYLHPETLQPLGYDITNTDLIREVKKRGTETDERMCLSAIETIDFRPLAGKWDQTERIPIQLSTPMTRFRLIADDYSDFLVQTEEARRRGEKYYVILKYESDIPGGFSLSDGEAMDPVDGGEFSASLPIVTLPGITMPIASDWLFNPPQRHIHTVTINVLNSAKAIVSQAKGIQFPTERGKLTTVTGSFLTNFITGGIQIDNLWAGEIIIQIE